MAFTKTLLQTQGTSGTITGNWASPTLDIQGATSVLAIMSINVISLPAKDVNDGVANSTEVTTLADSSGSLNSTFFTYQTVNSDNSVNNRYVWYNVNSAGVDPAPGGTGIEVALATDAAANTVASSTASALASDTNLSALAASDVVTMTNATRGTCAEVADGSAATGFDFNTAAAGVRSQIRTSEDDFAIPGHGYPSGLAVTVSSTGTLPTGLSTLTNYYVIVSDSDRIKVATSAANAEAGTPVNISSQGSSAGVMTITPVGLTAGQARLTKTIYNDIFVPDQTAVVTATGNLQLSSPTYNANLAQVGFNMTAGSVSVTWQVIARGLA